MDYEYHIKGLDRRLWTLSITRFIRSFGRGSTFFFLPLVFIIVYHISFIDTGLLLGTASVAMAITQYYSGLWTDRVGRRQIIVYSQIPNILFYLMIYYSIASLHYFIFMVASWYGTIIINSIQYPAIQAAVADVTSVKHRMSGYTVMRIMANLGLAAGPVLGAILAVYGFQYLFLLSAFTSAVEVLFLYRFMKETYTPEKRSWKRQNQDLYRSYHTDQFFIAFIFIGILLGFFLRQRGSSLGIYAIVMQHLPYLYLGLVWGLNGLLVVVLQFPILKLMTRYGNAMMWRGTGALIYALSFIVLTFVPTLGILLLFMTVSTVGEDFLSPTTQSIITTIAPESMRGSYIGIYNPCIQVSDRSQALL